MFTVSLFIFLILGIVHYIQYCRKWRKKYAELEKLPGPPNYPLIGNNLFWNSPKGHIKNEEVLIQKYGTLYKTWIGQSPLVICANAEDAEIVLSSQVNIRKSFLYNFVVPWLGTGLLISDGSKWHQRRKLLTPAFHFSILESFLTSMTEHGRTFVRKLKCMENEEEEWNIFPFVNRYTLDLISETAMGLRMNIQDSESSEYLQTVSNIGSIIEERIRKPWWHNDFLYSYSNLYKEQSEALKVLHATSRNVIQKSKEKRRTGVSNAEKTLEDHGVKKRGAFLDLLLDASESAKIPLAEEDIREEVDTFMFEGHDTTTSGILSTIHFLSTHLAVQERVAEELFSVFGDSERDPTLQDIAKLEYLGCVLKESHRLLPPVPSISRTLSEAVTLGGGKYPIPAGTPVRVNIFQLHRREEYFPDPMRFNPDNFTLDEARGRHPFAFAPFSAGPRNCIGQKFATLEEKVLLSSLLRSYKIKSSQSMEDLGVYFQLVLRHANGVRVRIEPRVWQS